MRSIRVRKTILSTGVAFAMAAGLSMGSAQAATTFTGFTDGCFGAACVPQTAAGPQSTVLGGLTFENSTFRVRDARGFAAICNVGRPPNVDNLGSFTLSGLPFTYTGNAFDLRVTFTAPPGTTPG